MDELHLTARLAAPPPEGAHQPAVSIGMPVYNGAKYLREALDSILAQTFTDYELIISDNASTDTTKEICEEYARRCLRIRYVRQQENKGALANFQFVLDQSDGQFFMWAAADERWDERWIESIYARISGEENMAGFGELVHVDKQALIMRHAANGARLQFVGNRLWRKLAFYLAYEGQGKANLVYALYPRKALRHINLLNYCFDYQILFAMLDRVEYVHVDGVRLYKRIHDDSESAAPENIWRSPIIFAPIRAWRRDIHIAARYLRGARPGLWLALTLLIPVKFMVAQKFNVSRAVILLCKKLGIG